MPIKMPPLTRTKSGLWTSRKVIPVDVRAVIGKSEDKPTWPSNLTQAQAKAAFREWLQDIEGRIEGARQVAKAEPQRLTRREITALGGEWYKDAKAQYEDDPGDPVGWEMALEHTYPDDPDDDNIVIQQHIETEIDALLLRERLLITEGSRKALSDEIHANYRVMCMLMVRRAHGDYSEDKLVKTMPAWAPQQAPKAKVSLTGLFEQYVAERSPSLSVVKDIGTIEFSK